MGLFCEFASGRPFSGGVDTGSREESASKQQIARRSAFI
jgi:hypothetical protein